MKLLLLLLLLSYPGKEMLGWTIQKDVPNVVDRNLKGMIRPKVSPSKARHNVDDSQYTMVIYVDRNDCPSCFVADLAEWEIVMQDCKREKLSLRFMFIFCVSDPIKPVFMATLSSSSISDVSYVDTGGIFAKRNPWIKKKEVGHIFLFGKQKEPIFMSTPVCVKEIKRTILAEEYKCA